MFVVSPQCSLQTDFLQESHCTQWHLREDTSSAVDLDYNVTVIYLMPFFFCVCILVVFSNVKPLSQTCSINESDR